MITMIMMINMLVAMIVMTFIVVKSTWDRNLSYFSLGDEYQFASWFCVHKETLVLTYTHREVHQLRTLSWMILPRSPCRFAIDPGFSTTMLYRFPRGSQHPFFFSFEVEICFQFRSHALLHWPNLSGLKILYQT